ncbi:MAG: choice-of-anchor D domain-containing protein [Ignavibacteriae bacterium]|nr:choice-of-anchor D domain-containing protein [Ignavibacteriota bacterium]MCB9214521.1 choice-of-anchor D domain-containing protein [Ignavibacteria bacterium]
MLYSLHARISTVLLLILFGASSLIAQGSGETFKSKNFPVPFGPDNVGTEFYFAFPANWEFAAGKKYVQLYISSGVATKVDIYVLGQFKKSVPTVANEIVTVELSNIEGQIFVRDDQSPEPNDQIYPGQAVRLVADDPIIVYAMNRTTFTSDGFLALPVNALGREYVVASAASVEGATQSLPSQYMIVAPYDGTSVTIVNSTDTPNHQEGQRFSISMKKGDVFSAMSVGNSGDLSGSYISSNKPIAVIAGQNCTYLPDFQYPACDHLVEMMTPLESWGTFYHALPFQNRTKGDTYRIFAGEPGADVIINGTKIATLSAVGGPRGIGWVEYREDARGPMEFTSNKRIFVAQYNNGQLYDNAGGSDPFYIILTPVEQYQDQFIFATPPADEFPQNFVNIIGDSAAVATAEIAEAGTENWRSAASAFTSIPYKFPTAIQGKKYTGLNIAITNGAWRMRSTGPLAAYIYAGSNFDSYGYPLSVATANLVIPDVVAPDIEWTQDCDGTVSGRVNDLPDDVTIRSNLSSVRLSTQGSKNYTILVDKFDAGINRATNFTLKVRDPKLDAVAVLVVSDMAGNVSFDTVRYFARNVTLTPNPVDFGEVMIGTTQNLPVTIKNSGNRTVTLKQVLLQKGDQNFTLIPPSDGLTLAPSQQVDATVQFTATTTGVFFDSIGIEDDCDIRWLVLARAEVVQPIIKVSDWPFGTVVINLPVPESHSLEIRNAGTGTLTITNGTGPSDPVFTLPNGLPAFPLELKAGQIRNLLVYFRPTAEQPYQDQVVFEHNAPDNIENDPVGLLTGRGIDATLFATPYNWPRKRVGTGRYQGIVYIKNIGEADARIFGVKDKIGDVGDFGIDDELNILNINVPANDSIPIAVSFSPQAIGNRQLKAVFNTAEQDETKDTNVYSILTGIGIVPGLRTTDLDFGSMTLGDPETMQTVDFELDGFWPDGNWRDTVWIDGFDFVSDNNGAGTDDFRYQLPAGTTFPIILIPNETESITITGFFAATLPGSRSGSLLARTRDGVDTVSRWVGRGTSQDAAVVAAVTAGDDLCLGLSDTLTATIESAGPVPLTISSLVLNDPSGEFVMLNPPGTPLTLLPGEIQTIEIIFTPVGTNGPRTATLDITSDDPANPVVTLQLTGSGREFNIAGRLLLSGTFPEGEDKLAVLGEDVTAKVMIDDLLDGVNATGYQVTLTYDPNDLFEPTNISQITLNPLVHPPGTTITFDGASTRGKLIFNVKAPSPLTGSGLLFEAPFGVVFNTNLTRSINLDIEFTDGAECAQITDVASAAIDVNPLCGLNLRLIELTSGKYVPPAALPNPIAGGMAQIEYGLGLDGETIITLFDATGNQVATLVNQYQQPGVYRVDFDATLLPAGVYYCRMVSGHVEYVSPIVVSN